MRAWNGDFDYVDSHLEGSSDSGSSDRSWPDPPDLMQRSAAPVYDAQDLVALLGVPANILWGWEQSLGIPRPLLVPDEHGSLLPRYSERDLMAALWLRDQIRLGMSQIEAAHRLLAGQRPLAQLPQLPPPAEPPYGRENSGPLGRMNPVPGLHPTTTPSLRGRSGSLAGLAQQSGPTSGPLMSGPPSTPIRLPGQIGAGALPRPQPGHISGPLGRPPGSPSASPSLGPVSGPLNRTYSPISGPWRRDPPLASSSGPLGDGPAYGATSGPLGRLSASGVFPSGATARQVQDAWVGAAPNSGRLAGSGNLRMYQSALLNAFAALDANEVHRLFDEVLAEYQVETVCTSVLQPVVSRAAELAAAGRMPPAAEQFGSLMVRNRLGALLDSLPLNPTAPLTLLACAPGEFHDLGPLVVAIFWRRAGLRVIYLGPDVAEDALILLAREHWQALFCLSAATDAGARQIARIAAAIARSEPPRPMMGYGGSAFVRSPELQRHVKESYFLGVDAYMATHHVVQLLTEGPIKPH